MARWILSLRFRRWTGRSIHWKHPQSLQEWIFANLLTAAKDPSQLQFYAKLADKIAVRNYVAERCPQIQLPQLLGVWKSVKDIPWATLPEKFAMKTNNGCGTNLIVHDKSRLNIASESKRLHRWLHFPYGQLSGQCHYSLIPPRIFAEEFLPFSEKQGNLPPDYKIFCFFGEPKFILYYEGRTTNGHVTPNMVFDLEWRARPEAVLRPINHPVPPPISLKNMTTAARVLSRDLRFARIDFYDINGQAYLGEITLTPDVVINFTPRFLEEAMRMTKPHNATATHTSDF